MGTHQLRNFRQIEWGGVSEVQDVFEKVAADVRRL
jgi:hypothetical protein